MTNAELIKLKKWLSHGAQIFIGHDHVGRKKIKVRHGPLRLITHRFEVSDEELKEIKSVLHH